MHMPYDDIINHPYPFALKYPRMSQAARAAQFAPFAALTGYDDKIDETRQLTEEQQAQDDSFAPDEFSS